MANLLLDICLTDIPKEYIKTSEKNGKKYLKIVVAERKEADGRGNDHFVKIFVPKELRKEGDNPIYIGSGKLSKPIEKTETKPVYSAPVGASLDKEDLPF